MLRNLSRSKEFRTKMASFSQPIFQSLIDKLTISKQFTESLMDDFFGLLGELFIDALFLMEEDNIRELVAPSERFLFQVCETSPTYDHDYYCFIRGNYCNCVGFQFDAINFDQFLWCKHLIAAKLASAIGEFETFQISDEDFERICKTNLLKI